MTTQEIVTFAEHGVLLVLIYLKLAKMEKHMYKILAWIEVNQKWRPEWERFSSALKDDDSTITPPSPEA